MESPHNIELRQDITELSRDGSAAHSLAPSRRMLLRLALMTGISTFAISLWNFARARTGSVITGAIRWDAWYDPQGSIGLAAETSLGPTQFQDRMPFFGTVTGQDKVVIDGNYQAVMDKEIAFARAMGLNYWAYCWYPRDSPMQRAWNLHQSSKHALDVSWCMIWQLSHLGGQDTFRNEIPSYVSWLNQKNYQRVKGGRPIIYLYIDTPKAIAKDWDNDWNRLAASLDELRSAFSQAEIIKPYLVIMESEPAEAAGVLQKLKGDAISNYMAWVPRRKASFSDLTSFGEQYWQKMADTGDEIVPVVMTGWDTRPRKLHPPPWEKAPAPAEREDQKYVIAGTTREIFSAILSAESFVTSHPQACPANAIIIYSWNECDEGGGALVSNTFLKTLGRQRFGQK